MFSLDVSFSKPDDCRNRNLSYFSQLYVDIENQVTKTITENGVPTTENILYSKTPMGDIPMMVSSFTFPS
jgi:DNA-directed RNA polymerase beta subunit